MESEPMTATRVAGATLAALALGMVVVGAPEGKLPSVKEVMKQLNYRDAALCPTLGKALKAEPVNWDAVQEEARQFVVLAAALPKNDPPAGDRASWMQRTRAYVAVVQELNAAAQRRDRAAALTAHGKLANPATCNGCHTRSTATNSP